MKNNGTKIFIRKSKNIKLEYPNMLTGMQLLNPINSLASPADQRPVYQMKTAAKIPQKIF
jgi:hypothetical protein